MPPELQGSDPKKDTGEDTASQPQNNTPEPVSPTPEAVPAAVQPIPSTSESTPPQAPTPPETMTAPEVASVPAAEPEIPTSFNTTPQVGSASKKVSGILVIILILGVLGVGAVFASKIFSGPSVNTDTLLLEAMNKYIAQENFAVNSSVSVDVNTYDEFTDETISGNVTVLSDSFLSQESLETRGSIYVNLAQNSLNASGAYLLADNNMYVSLEDLTLNINEDSPELLTFLAFFPTDLLKGKWLQIPFTEAVGSNTLEVNGVKYNNASEAASATLAQIKVVAATPAWQDLFTNRIQYSEEKSTNDLYAYSPNFTSESLLSYFDLLGASYVLDDLEADTEEIVGIMNNQTIYVTKDADISSITLVDHTFSDETTDALINVTITNIPFEDLAPPENYTDIDEFFAQIFGGGF